VKYPLSFLIIASLWLLADCAPNPYDDETGSISVSIANDLNSRSLLPSIDMTPASFRITGIGPNGSSFDDGISGNSATIAKLAFGEWTVTVNALNNDAIVIGQGTEKVTVATNKTTFVEIKVLPLTGKGSLSVTMNWTGTVENASVSGTIRPISTTGSPQRTFSLDRDHTTYSSSKDAENGDLEAGYYTLLTQLFDTGTLVAGTAETVRIVAGQSTAGTISLLHVQGAGGSIEVTITPEMSNPIAVAISRGSATTADARLLNFNASVTGYSATPSYTWYVNGVLSTAATGTTLSLGTSLNEGYYRVDVVALGASQAGSAGFVFYWQGSLSSAPQDPGKNWAYFDSTFGLPYIYIVNGTSGSWEPFSTPTAVHTVSLAASKEIFPAIGLGWDYDEFAPESRVGGAPGFGSSSFYSNVSGEPNAPNAPDTTRTYSALRIRPQALLGRETVTFGDLESISYWSKQVEAETRTWQLKIYTEPESGDPKWYKTRFNSKLASPSSTQWMFFSTDGGANQLVFDKLTKFYKMGEATKESTAYPSPLTLAGAKDFNGFDAHIANVDCRAEKILWIDIIAGDNSAGPIHCYLDGVVIQVKNARPIVLDLGD
jgi:hypothetical protein